MCHPSGAKLSCGAGKAMVASAAPRRGGWQQPNWQGPSWASLPSRNQGSWSDAVTQCHARFRVGKCVDCGRNPAFPESCRFPLCPKCMPSRLSLDWRRHGDSFPQSMTTIRLAPKAHETARQVRGRFFEWRKRAGLAAAVYGLQAFIADGQPRSFILLAVPDEEAVKVSSGRAFEVEFLASGQGPDEVLAWLQSCYLDEAASWQTSDELLALLAETSGRRRFQGFGSAYQRPDQEATDTESQPLRRVSGGSGRVKQAEMSCPFCGGRVEFIGVSVGLDSIEKAQKGYLWRGPPR